MFFHTIESKAGCNDGLFSEIQGPISQCNAFSGPNNYYLTNPGSGTINWTCVGGTVSYIGNQATVNWIINEPVYSLTVTFMDPINDTPPCTLTIYLNDCDCEGTGDPGTLIITDLYDMDYLRGGNPDLVAIANVIDPSGIYATVVSIPNNDHIFVHDAMIFIRGQFNMSQTPVYFKNCTVFMDKGSVIYTPTQGNGSLGLVFDVTSIQGICNNMWQGIRVGREGKLKIVNQSSLSDAEYGIQVNVKMHIFLEDSKFFKNYITLYSAPNYSNGIEGNIENCDFDGGQDLVTGRYLLQNYIGQFPINGRHSAPQSNKVFAAMELSDIIRPPVNPSIPFNLIANANVFHNFNIGIFGRNSEIDVYNCSFVDIKSVNVYNFYGNYNGTAVYADNLRSLPSFLQSTCNIGNYDSGPVIKTNYFKNVNRGVLIQGNIFSNTINNTFDDVSFIGIEIRRSFANRTHIVETNNINNARHGILSNINLGSTININKNFVQTINTGSSAPWGIVISDISGSACQASVENNVVYAFSSLGIYGRSNSRSLYRFNSVTLDNTNLTPGLRMAGIQLDNCSRSTVDCNYSGNQMWPQNSFYNFYGRGIFLNFSPDNVVSCNTSVNNLIDFQFLANCNPSQFYGNKLFTSNDGLLLGDYNTGAASDMGNQGLVNGINSPGNIFYGNDNFGTFTHAATMTVNSSPINGSLWVNSGLYNPIINTTSGGVPIQPFIANSYSPFACPDVCGNNGGGGEIGSSEAIVLNTYNPTSLDEEVLKWDREKRLYEKLRADSSALDSSIILENFADSTQFNNKGKLGQITTDFKSISEAKADGISSADIDIMVQESLNKNSTIQPNAIYEETQKRINEIILNSILKDRWEFTATEWNDILQIANSCPYTCGPAVFDARSLANSVDITLNFDDVNICLNSPGFRKKSQAVVKDNFMRVYPNPAGESISIIAKINVNDKVEFQIYNALGIKVYTKDIKSMDQLNNISIQMLSGGIYNTHLIVNDEIYFLGKLSVIH